MKIWKPLLTGFLAGIIVGMALLAAFHPAIRFPVYSQDLQDPDPEGIRFGDVGPGIIRVVPPLPPENRGNG